MDGKRWTGKIRLLGFVDVFFLICYTGTARFEQGIIIHSKSRVSLCAGETKANAGTEDDEAILGILTRAGFKDEKLDPYILNKKTQEKDKGTATTWEVPQASRLGSADAPQLLTRAQVLQLAGRRRQLGLHRN